MLYRQTLETVTLSNMAVDLKHTHSQLSRVALSVFVGLIIFGSWLVGISLMRLLATSELTTPASAVTVDVEPPAGLSQKQLSPVQTSGAERSTVKVRSGGDPVTTGSGFVVGKCVFTNSHVVGSYGDFTVEVSSIATGNSTSVVTSTTVVNLPAPDIAIGIIDDVDMNPGAVRDFTGMSLADTDAAAGQNVAMLGFAFGETLHTPTVRVQAMTEGLPYGYQGQVLLLDGLTVAGFSGGPVINSVGEVVGMLAGYDHATELAIAVPVSSLQAAIDVDESGAPELCDKELDELS